jgi:hypothetical protein
VSRSCAEKLSIKASKYQSLSLPLLNCPTELGTTQDNGQIYQLHRSNSRNIRTDRPVVLAIANREQTAREPGETASTVLGSGNGRATGNERGQGLIMSVWFDWSAWLHRCGQTQDDNERIVQEPKAERKRVMMQLLHPANARGYRYRRGTGDEEGGLMSLTSFQKPVKCSTTCSWCIIRRTVMESAITQYGSCGCFHDAQRKWQDLTWSTA